MLSFEAHLAQLLVVLLIIACFFCLGCLIEAGIEWLRKRRYARIIRF
jgi:hypothetical protein